VAALNGCATTAGGAAGRVVVVGGGYGGATAAKYIKLWAPNIDVTIVEPNPYFISCPISNLVLGGHVQLKDISLSYEQLQQRGVRIVRDTALAVDAATRTVRLASGAVLSFDRAVVSPGIEFMYDQIPALQDVVNRSRILHAWKAGPETTALRQQLEALPNGGVYVIHIPMAPYRCPPGPYERICQIASYFKEAKPKSKIIVLDANADVVSKKGLFLAAWNGLYKGMIDYRPNSELVDVDVKTMTVKLAFDDVKGDILNIVPPQRAAGIAATSGLITANNRWCGVDWTSCESLAVKGVHVLGDSTLAANAMPKSASMANQQAKVCAAGVIALMQGEAVNTDTMMMNTCYSFVSGDMAMHVASVHRYDAAQKTLLPVAGSGGVSVEASAAEAIYAWGWARNIWADALT
jgi:sulfite dehydrogenase